MLVLEAGPGSIKKHHNFLLHDGTHVQRVIREYTAYFNQERPHQGIRLLSAKIKANQRAAYLESDPGWNNPCLNFSKGWRITK